MGNIATKRSNKATPTQDELLLQELEDELTELEQVEDFQKSPVSDEIVLEDIISEDLEFSVENLKFEKFYEKQNLLVDNLEKEIEILNCIKEVDTILHNVENFQKELNLLKSSDDIFDAISETKSNELCSKKKSFSDVDIAEKKEDDMEKKEDQIISSKKIYKKTKAQEKRHKAILQIEAALIRSQKRKNEKLPIIFVEKLQIIQKNVKQAQQNRVKQEQKRQKIEDLGRKLKTNSILLRFETFFTNILDVNAILIAKKEQELLKNIENFSKKLNEVETKQRIKREKKLSKKIQKKKRKKQEKLKRIEQKQKEEERKKYEKEQKEFLNRQEIAQKIAEENEKKQNKIFEFNFQSCLDELNQNIKKTNLLQKVKIKILQIQHNFIQKNVISQWICYVNQLKEQKRNHAVRILQKWWKNQIKRRKLKKALAHHSQLVKIRNQRKMKLKIFMYHKWKEHSENSANYYSNLIQKFSKKKNYLALVTNFKSWEKQSVEAKKKKIESCIVIQRYYRGYYVRKCMKDLKNSSFEMDSINDLQEFGYIDTTEYLFGEEEEAEEEETCFQTQNKIHKNDRQSLCSLITCLHNSSSEESSSSSEEKEEDSSDSYGNLSTSSIPFSIESIPLPPSAKANSDVSLPSVKQFLEERETEIPEIERIKRVSASEKVDLVSKDWGFVNSKTSKAWLKRQKKFKKKKTKFNAMERYRNLQKKAHFPPNILSWNDDDDDDGIHQLNHNAWE